MKLQLRSRRRMGEQLRFPGMEASDLPDPAAVVGKETEDPPPPFQGKPKVLKPEGGDLSPWQRAQLDREYVEIGKLEAATQIESAEASAGLWEREEHLKADHRARDERSSRPSDGIG
jgi:hypothetical protein